VRDPDAALKRTLVFFLPTRYTKHAMFVPPRQSVLPKKRSISKLRYHGLPFDTCIRTPEI
jgi:hypothetical protein